MANQVFPYHNLRRVIFVIFALSFLSITTAILTYGNGYTIDVKNRSIIATGSLLVKTTPRTSTVTINGKAEYDTPLRVTRIIPREVDVKIEKDGYFPWQKTLEVYPKSTTFVDTTLFTIPEPHITQSFKKTEQTFLVPGNSRMILFTERQPILTISDAGKLSKFPILLPFIPSEAEIFWSPDNQRAIIRLSSRARGLSHDVLYSLARPDEIQELPQPERFLQFMYWDSAQPWVALVKDSAGQLARLNTISKKAELVRSLLTVEGNGFAIEDSVFTADGHDPLELPSGRYQYLVNHGGAHFVKNISNKTLLEVYNEEYIVLSFDADHYTHDGSGGLLLYNDFELWHKTVGSPMTLLLRSSEPIDAVHSVNDTGYAAVLINGKISLLEYDGRGARNQFELKVDADIRSFTVVGDTTFAISDEKQLIELGIQ